MNKTFITLIVACLFSLCFSFTSAAAPASSMQREVPKLSFNITLLEDTPMYSSPDETLRSRGIISPQDVHVIGAEENWLSYHADTEKKWFKVKTWLGDEWIRLELRKTGTIEANDMYLWLSKNVRLYDSPFSDTSTGLALSSQTVHVLAHYRSKFTNSYLVETWAGKKWLVDLANNFFPVTKIHEQIELTTTISIFDTPMPYNGEKGVFSPQIVTAFQKYNEWYLVVTSNGVEAWINKKFAQPEGVKQTNESVKVSVITPLQKYPYVYEINMGAIAPQTVKAFETWISPEGESWFHIHSWQGDAWIRTVKSQQLTKESAMEIAKQMDPNGNAQWTAEFIGKYQVEPSKEIRPIWAVTAKYPAGNKMIVYIDAITGKQVGLTEIEAGF
jgi:hypothetical protein